MDRLQELVRQQFPKYQISPLSGGGTNAVFLLEQNGIRSVLKVAMISNSNASVERECLRLLRERRIAPHLYQDLMIAERIGLRMEYVSGKSLLSSIQECIKASDIYTVYRIFSALGQTLAEVHHLHIENSVKLRKIELEDPPKKSFIDAKLYTRSVELFSELRGVFDQHPVLLHGDFGYHNVIGQSLERMKLIDWELAALGDARIDIANVLFWTHLHFPDIALDCVKAFVDAYIEMRAEDCSSDILHRFVIYQIWRMIHMITDDFPIPVKAEWNRRLSWAFDHVFY